MQENKDIFDTLYLNNKLLKKITKEINSSFFNMCDIQNSINNLINNYLCKYNKYLMLDIQIFSHDAIFNEQNFFKGIDIQNNIIKYDYKKLQFKSSLLYSVLEKLCYTQIYKIIKKVITFRIQFLTKYIKLKKKIIKHCLVEMKKDIKGLGKKPFLPDSNRHINKVYKVYFINSAKIKIKWLKISKILEKRLEEEWYEPNIIKLNEVFIIIKEHENLLEKLFEKKSLDYFKRIKKYGEFKYYFNDERIVLKADLFSVFNTIFNVIDSSLMLKEQILFNLILGWKKELLDEYLGNLKNVVIKEDNNLLIYNYMMQKQNWINENWDWNILNIKIIDNTEKIKELFKNEFNKNICDYQNFNFDKIFKNYYHPHYPTKCVDDIIIKKIKKEVAEEDDNEDKDAIPKNISEEDTEEDKYSLLITNFLIEDD